MTENQPGISTDPEKVFFVDKLRVEIHAGRPEVGRAAARHISGYLNRTIAENGAVRAIFASAPSQNEFLDNLALDSSIDWAKVTTFHLDEYLGLAGDAPQTFGTYLRERLFNRITGVQVHYLDGAATDPAGECRRYSRLLAEAAVDLSILGIGENGHIAFNDPPLADFNDPEKVRVVDLDEISRVQQVNDGCFPTLDVVPRQALTVTIPVMMAAKKIVAIVPGPTKAKAIYATLTGPISPLCPASILRQHPAATLLIDRASAALLGI
ncbi:MAG: glucosamine-6-phosphate deaminase [Chloroflexi bacterium]|nr:glucosamine-6-phosphate deaminase [Chloroflexota bacterium]